eukprot:GHVU01167390.1.p1 GENE.GHVU01167390.1~~GHVU01167390.1.p1  ORF type:complete len:243 (+),score=101.26 GHVU01167390.1:193-921(+)
MESAKTKHPELETAADIIFKAVVGTLQRRLNLIRNSFVLLDKLRVRASHLEKDAGKEMKKKEPKGGNGVMAEEAARMGDDFLNDFAEFLRNSDKAECFTEKQKEQEEEKEEQTEVASDTESSLEDGSTTSVRNEESKDEPEKKTIKEKKGEGSQEEDDEEESSQEEDDEEESSQEEQGKKKEKKKATKGKTSQEEQGGSQEEEPMEEEEGKKGSREVTNIHNKKDTAVHDQHQHRKVVGGGK